ncbi:hypothetical protein BO85DRAFT_329568, partial [Aspergillus piperis CBS 112811]
SSLLYHAYTLYLFTINDFKTMVGPSIAFAIFHTPSDKVHTHEILLRLPHMFAYSWINLLAFTINNQCQPASIAEDRLNKPWRPLPAGRLSPAQAQVWGRLSTVLAIILSSSSSVSSINMSTHSRSGQQGGGAGWSESVLLAVLGWIYNDLGQGNGNWAVRNLLNAAGFTSFAAGTLEVALRTPLLSLSSWSADSNDDNVQLLWWIGMIAAVVATTVQLQDMYDQKGDAAAGRRTLPLVVGDRAARLFSAIAIMAWSLLCPFYWSSGFLGYLAPMVLGLWTVVRSFTLKSESDDRVTFRIYNCWLVSLYALP